MNAIEVYREVSAMISQGYIESESALRASLNRALAEIGRLYPRKQFLTLRHMRSPSVFRLAVPREVKKESPLTVSALACKKIVFRGSGQGEVLITRGGKTLWKEALDGLPFLFDRVFSSSDDLNEEETMLLFRTESGMVLEELVLYHEIAEEACGYRGKYRLYRMAEELPSFVSFSGECYKNRLLIESGDELILENDSVLIDADAMGVYEIGCYAAPKVVTEENEGDTLDLSADLLFLVPLLTAYYACLEAEDARADDFLTRYEKSRDAFRKTARFSRQDTVEDVRGW